MSTERGVDTDRLAELVVHLTGCDPERARELVDREGTPAITVDDKLDRVARALVALRRQPAPIDLDAEAEAARASTRR